MGLGLLKFGFLFLLISGSLLSTSFAAFAGRRSKLVSNLAADVDAIQGEGLNKEEVNMVHERLLGANTRDYGKYFGRRRVFDYHFRDMSVLGSGMYEPVYS